MAISLSALTGKLVLSAVTAMTIDSALACLVKNFIVVFPVVL
jgi:hypothetical protein